MSKKIFSIDIVIVNYNSTDYLLRCLESIENNLNGLVANIIIYDNASVDNPERITNQFSDVSLIVNRFNIGFSAAVNRAFQKCFSPFVLLLNPDSIIKDGFFEPIIGFMERHHEVSVVGPKVMNEDGTIQGSARAFPTLLTGLFGRRSFLSRLFPNNRFTRGNIIKMSLNGGTPMEVDWVSGACMLIRRKAIEDVGGMDERFFMYWEDADWCRRMWQKGWKVVYFPLSTIVHFVGASSNTLPLKSTVEFHKSSYRIYKKYTKWPYIRPTAACY